LVTGTRALQEEEIARLRQEIADLRARLPRHSVPPAMLLHLEELEEKLEALVNGARLADRVEL